MSEEMHSQVIAITDDGKRLEALVERIRTKNSFTIPQGPRSRPPLFLVRRG